MFIHIDPSNGLAIYDQVIRQVKFAVASGVLKAGELIPSVRELARDLAINPNTVARAYRELQSQEVLEMVRGTGLEVAVGAAKRCRADRTKLIRERVRQALNEAAHSQIDLEELEALVNRELRRIDKGKGKS